MLTFTNEKEVRTYKTPTKLYKKKVLVEAVQINEPFLIETVVNGERESLMQGNVGDFVCIGVQNEVWRVEKAIFEATYGREEDDALLGQITVLEALNTDLNVRLEKAKADLQYLEKDLGPKLDRLQDIFQEHDIGLAGDDLLTTAADILKKLLG